MMLQRMLGKLRTFVAQWRKWGAPMWISLLSPWQDRGTGLDLTSTWFEDFFLLDLLCSAAGALGVIVIYMFLADEPRSRQRAWALGLLGVFVPSFVATLAFFLTMDRYWSPDGEWAAIIETGWALSYTLMLVGLGGTVMALLLARRRGRAAAASPA